MQKYIEQLLEDLQASFHNLPDYETFKILFGDPEDMDEPVGPEKTIAEWFGIDLEWFPRADRLSKAQMDSISDELLSFWDEEDDMHTWLNSIPSEIRYEAILDFFSSKARYDGMGRFYTKAPETEEEWEEFLSGLGNPFDDFGFIDDLF